MTCSKFECAYRPCQTRSAYAQDHPTRHALCPRPPLLPKVFFQHGVLLVHPLAHYHVKQPQRRRNHTRQRTPHHRVTALVWHGKRVHVHRRAHADEPLSVVVYVEHRPERDREAAGVAWVPHDAVHAVRDERVCGPDRELKGKAVAERAEAVCAQEGAGEREGRSEEEGGRERGECVWVGGERAGEGGEDRVGEGGGEMVVQGEEDQDVEQGDDWCKDL